MNPIDVRSRDVLDFDRICGRLAGLTHAPRAFELASNLEPATDFGHVRRLVAETAEMRSLLIAAGRGRNF